MIVLLPPGGRPPKVKRFLGKLEDIVVNSPQAGMRPGVLPDPIDRVRVMVHIPRKPTPRNSGGRAFDTQADPFGSSPSMHLVRKPPTSEATCSAFQSIGFVTCPVVPDLFRLASPTCPNRITNNNFESVFRGKSDLARSRLGLSWSFSWT